MRAFLLGIVVGILIIIWGVYAYFAKGYAPVATDAKPMPFERKLANMALHARIDKEMPTNVPVPANESTYLAGAHDYLTHCAVCHGVPDKEQTAIARGEFPKPPRLFHGKGVTDDPAGETYWKIANGIRLTGMPGFKDSLSETQMWQIAVLLANADKIPDSVKAVLAGQAEAAPVPAPVTPPPAAPGQHTPGK